MGAWFPSQERSFATSLFDSMAKFSSALGVPVLGVVLLHIGWRMTFALTGIISLLFGALFYFVYRDPEDDPELTPAEAQFIQAGQTAGGAITSTPVYTLGDLLKQPKIIGFSLGFGFKAVTVALLGALEPLAVIPAALFVGLLEAGSLSMQRQIGVPSALVAVIEGLTMLFVLAATVRRT